MEFTTIDYCVNDPIATITLNRPHARNGFTISMADELGTALRAADLDEEVLVVVLTAAGSDFCVGMDMTADTAGVDDIHAPDWVEPATRVVRPMANMNKPVIAAIQGAAVGVGVTLTLAADYRLAATDARFGFVFARRGLFPEGGSMWFLPRIVGLARAKDWMLSGRVFGVDEALAAGLVNSVHAPDELRTAAQDLARELADHTAPVSVAAIRRGLITMAGSSSPEAAFALDAKLISHASTSADLYEGIASFLQKRPPHFTGNVRRDLPQLSEWLEGGTI
jgi:enoyl-CoA hydratase/carnithine racemase